MKKAQAWADLLAKTDCQGAKCHTPGDERTLNGECVGENLSWTSMPVGPEGAGRDATRAWYCEVDAYRGNTGGVTGHFTQVSPYDDCIRKEMMHTFYSIG